MIAFDEKWKQVLDLVERQSTLKGATDVYQSFPPLFESNITRAHLFRSHSWSEVYVLLPAP
jgi:hypothetical protein